MAMEKLQFTPGDCLIPASPMTHGMVVLFSDTVDGKDFHLLLREASGTPGFEVDGDLPGWRGVGHGWGVQWQWPSVFFRMHSGEKRFSVQLDLKRVASAEKLTEILALVFGRGLPEQPQYCEEPEWERCPCCTFLTLRSRGDYEICPVCFWEDDASDSLDGISAVNGISLREGKRNFLKYGACKAAFSGLTRPPLDGEY